MDDERLRTYTGTILLSLLSGPPLMYENLIRTQRYEDVRRKDGGPVGTSHLKVEVELGFSAVPSLKEYFITATEVCYRLRLRRDWHLRIYQQGIAVVEECLILDAAKTGKERTLAGAECWQCLVLAPVGEGVQGLVGIMEYVVRYGGICRRGAYPHIAFDRVLNDWKGAFELRGLEE